MEKKFTIHNTSSYLCAGKPGADEAVDGDDAGHAGGAAGGGRPRRRRPTRLHHARVHTADAGAGASLRKFLAVNAQEDRNRVKRNPRLLPGFITPERMQQMQEQEPLRHEKVVSQHLRDAILRAICLSKSSALPALAAASCRASMLYRLWRRRTWNFLVHATAPAMICKTALIN